LIGWKLNSKDVGAGVGAGGCIGADGREGVGVVSSGNNGEGAGEGDTVDSGDFLDDTTGVVGSGIECAYEVAIERSPDPACSTSCSTVVTWQS
jgi:deoxycytidylate deaminase